MRALFLPILVGLLCLAAPALGENLLIVQSTRDSASNEALREFRAACAVDVDSRVLVLSDYADVDLLRTVREERPNVILTVGEAALKAARKIRRVPVIAILSLSLTGDRGLPEGVTGVSLRIAPVNYMKVFTSLGLKRVGVVYDPARSGTYLEEARQAAARTGIDLVLRTAQDPRETLKQLEGLKGKVDGLWLIPDVSVVTAPTLEAYVNFSLSEKKPIISYGGEHLRRGAAVSLVLDWGQVGRQACELVRRVIAEAAPRELPVQSPSTFSLKHNDSVLRNLGLNPTRLDKLFSNLPD